MLLQHLQHILVPCPLKFEAATDISCVNICIIVASLSTEKSLVINVESTRSTYSTTSFSLEPACCCKN